MKTICDYCKKEFNLRPSKVKRAKRHFCNLECRTLFFNARRAEKESKVRHRDQCFNEFTLFENYAVFKVESKKFGVKDVYIDLEDVESVSKIFWHVCFMYKDYYSVVGWDKSKKYEVLLHRYLLNAPKDKMVDHINRNPLDNRRCNLRLVDNSANQHNKTLLCTSTQHYKGVRLRPHGRWQARIMVNKKPISIGHFATEEEAVKAREEFCKKHNIIS